MGRLVYGSVCSGIEAASVAWHPLGWNCAFVSEIEAFPRAVLQHRWPETPLHGDFTTIQERDYAPIDLLVGGTPCQSFSVAGLRGGLADDRGNLALEYLRLADRLRPRWLVWENVPGVLSSAGGRDFGSILGGLVELGYGFAYRVLDAQFFGVAQRRRRVFVVGHLGDWRRAAAVLFERHSLQGHPSPRREAGEGVARCLTHGPGSGQRYGGESETFIAQTVGTLAAGMGRRNGDEGVDGAATGKLIAHTLKGEGFDASEDGTGRGTPIVPVCFSSKDRGADAEIDLSPTLRAGGHDGSHANAGVPPAIAFAIQERAVSENPEAGPDGAGFRSDGAAYTLEARSVPQAVAFALRGREGGAMPEISGDQVGALRSASGGSSRDYVAAFAGALSATMGRRNGSPTGDSAEWCAVATPSAVRRLTPRECERLQGFPDDYTLIPWRKGMAPDGPRYKALGNSMAVPVMAWIGRRIEAVEALRIQAEAA